ncbi:MAG: hypothetical protein KGQ41_00205 [Alphaproteobacteria bacterium]|nr:hypothetical protein [Alphaproteobacteria bacterium]
MQIDLLASRGGEVGLLASSAFSSDVSGVIFDVAERSLTLEFGASMDSMKLNCPVGEDMVPFLKAREQIHACCIEKGRMIFAKQVPLVTVSHDEDDVAGTGSGLPPGVSGVMAWLKKVTSGQTIHRDNLGDTSSNGGIIHREGLSAATLQAAPQLAKVLVQEQAMVQKSQLQNQPRMAPPSLGPGATSPMPGLGNLMPRTPRGGSTSGGEGDE